MGEIKSSWEIAMERTAGIKSDKSSIRQNELKKNGQKIASEYMDAETADPVTITKGLKHYPREERHTVEKAVLEILLSHITLPRNGEFEEKVQRVMIGLQPLLDNKRVIQEISSQLSQFLNQFLQHREQLTEQLKQQYTPQLRQKQQQLKKQYGYEVELKHEQDPEFNSLLRKNLQNLESQYQDALGQMKDQIRNYYGS